ncbi:hypothetical protein [Streptococcus suis]
MKNYLQKLNKNALKLSLICGLNWLIKQVISWQFLFAIYVFLGLLLRIVFRTLDSEVSATLIILIMLIQPVRKCLKDIKAGFISLIKYIVLMFILLAGYQLPFTERSLKISFYMFLICGLIYLLGKLLQVKLFNAFLFKHVIDKEYLGIRKLTDPLPPESNLYTDVEEANVDKRMTIINQRAVKSPYQDCVELTYLNQEILTGVGYETKPYGEEDIRNFIIADRLYYPVFTVHLFGKEENFYHRLIDFKLSRKAAFTDIGVRKLNQGE